MEDPCPARRADPGAVTPAEQHEAEAHPEEAEAEAGDGLEPGEGEGGIRTGRIRPGGRVPESPPVGVALLASVPAGMTGAVVVVVVAVDADGGVVVVVVVVVTAAATVNVKHWVAGVPIPLVAVKVIGKDPVAVGVPASTPDTKVTPAGSVPVVLVMVGAGLPDAVGVKVPAVPAVKVVVAAEVNAGAELPAGTAVQVNPVGSVELALKVIWMPQLSVTTPLVLAHASPTCQAPLAVVPEPEYSSWASVAPPPDTRGAHSKLLGIPTICPVPMAVLTGP